MSISLGSNISLHARLPLDERTLVESLDDLRNFPENFLADMAYAFVKETNKMYIFSRENEVLEDLGKWREAGKDSSLEEELVANVACGNIKVNDVLPLGMTFTEFVKKQVVAELAPTVKITSPVADDKEVGEITSSVKVVAYITKKTFPISKIECFCNGSKFGEITSQATSGEVEFDYTRSTDDETLKFEVKATDTAGKSSTAAVTITYSYAVFYGANTGTEYCNDNDKVRALENKKLNVKSEDTITVTANAGTQNFAVAIPSTKSISSIKFVESLNMEMIDDMVKIENVPVEGYGGYEAINYRVYQYVAMIPFSQTSHFTVKIG